MRRTWGGGQISRGRGLEKYFLFLPLDKSMIITLCFRHGTRWKPDRKTGVRIAARRFPLVCCSDSGGRRSGDANHRGQRLSPSVLPYSGTAVPGIKKPRPRVHENSRLRGPGKNWADVHPAYFLSVVPGFRYFGAVVRRTTAPIRRAGLPCSANDKRIVWCSSRPADSQDRQLTGE